MMTTHMTTNEHSLFLEPYAERTALAVVRGMNFTQCLHINGVVASLEVVTPKNQRIMFHGRDLYNDQTWKKFLLAQSQSVDLCRLTGVVDLLVHRYRTWLLTTYTRRYQTLAKREDLDWFEQVTLLVVVRRIMERKYTASIYEQREDAFADPWVAEEMSLLIRLGIMATEIAKSIHHIVKQPGTAQTLVEQLYTTHAAYLEKRPRHPRIALTPLPAEIAPPLVLLARRTGTDHGAE